MLSLRLAACRAANAAHFSRAAGAGGAGAGARCFSGVSKGPSSGVTAAKPGQQQGALGCEHCEHARTVRGKRQSVTSVVYPKRSEDRAGLPVVEVFTTIGCGLCDAACEMLRGLRREAPHTLIKQDITDAQHRAVFRHYKHHIPVFRINGAYWAKHRITHEEAVDAIGKAAAGVFDGPAVGDPLDISLEDRRKKRKIEK